LNAAKVRYRYRPTWNLSWKKQRLIRTGSQRFPAEDPTMERETPTCYASSCTLAVVVSSDFLELSILPLQFKWAKSHITDVLYVFTERDWEILVIDYVLGQGNQWSMSQARGEALSAWKYRTLPYGSTRITAGSNPAFLKPNTVTYKSDITSIYYHRNYGILVRVRAEMKWLP
jgi:hypothetical protein